MSGSKKKSLSEEIAELFNPNPTSVVAEEDNDLTLAKLDDVELGEGDFDKRLLERGTSKLRTLNDNISLEGGVYAGKRSSRRKLYEEDEEEEDEETGDSEDGEEEEDDDDESEDDEGFEEEDEDDENEEEIEDEDEDDEEAMKKKMKRKMEEDAAREAEELQKQLMQLQTEGEVVSGIVKSEETEKEKATHTYNQVKLWDSLLDFRIKQQKALSIANKLPQYNTYNTYKNLNKKINTSYETLSSSIRSLLGDLIDLQQNLRSQSEAFNDEEIVDLKLNDEDDPWLCIEKIQQSLAPAEEKVIEKWSQKAKLSFGKLIANKSLKTLNQGLMDQINQLLADKDKSIQRMHLKRSDYKVLGKRQRGETTSSPTKKSKTDEEYDEEIIDDSDFYQELLKDLIDNTVTPTDSIGLGRKWLEVKELQTTNKVRKNVDRKASKGRKIRYQIHDKLVNFMPPVPQEESVFVVDELFTNLFK